MIRGSMLRFVPLATVVENGAAAVVTADENSLPAQE
jgi:hypothetical protein